MLRCQFLPVTNPFSYQEFFYVVFLLAKIFERGCVRCDVVNLHFPGEVLVGNLLQMNCLVTSSHGLPVAGQIQKWNFISTSKKTVQLILGDSHKFFVSNSQDKSTVTFRAVLKSDEGTYECVAVDSATGKLIQASKSLRVIVPPVIKAYGTEVPVGQTATLSCPGTDFSRILWSFNGNRLFPSSKYRFRPGGYLDIAQLRKEDGGQYRCTAYNSIFNASAYPSLVVQYGPIILEEPQNESIGAEDTARFRCASDAVPRATVTWKINGNYLNYSNGRYKMYQEGQVDHLFIVDAETGDSGSYSCFYSNAVNWRESKQAYLDVEGITVVNLYKNECLQVGVDNSLRCQALPDEMVMSPSVVWTKDQIPIDLLSEHRDRFHVQADGTLSIRNTSVYDKGSFKCRVEVRNINIYASFQQIISTVVRGAPETPILLEVSLLRSTEGLEGLVATAEWVSPHSDTRPVAGVVVHWSVLLNSKSGSALVKAPATRTTFPVLSYNKTVSYVFSVEARNDYGVSTSDEIIQTLKPAGVCNENDPEPEYSEDTVLFAVAIAEAVMLAILITFVFLCCCKKKSKLVSVETNTTAKDQDKELPLDGVYSCTKSFYHQQVLTTVNSKASATVSSTEVGRRGETFV